MKGAIRLSLSVLMYITFLPISTYVSCVYGQSYANATSTIGIDFRHQIYGSNGIAEQVFPSTQSIIMDSYPTTTILAWLSSSVLDSFWTSFTGDTILLATGFVKVILFSCNELSRSFPSHILFLLLFIIPCAAIEYALYV